MVEMRRNYSTESSVFLSFFNFFSASQPERRLNKDRTGDISGDKRTE